MATQGVLGPSVLPSGRLRIAMDDVIHDLNVDKTPLLKLLSMVGKETKKRMKFEWMTQELMSSWGTLSAVGGAWAGGAANNGTLTVPAGEAYKYASGDVITLPGQIDVNIYISSVNLSTGVLTCRTVDGSNIDLSGASTGADKIFNITNSFELGSGKGTIKDEQPTEHYNYLQITQTPVGVVETMLHLDYVGGDELKRKRNMAGIDHAFKIEKTLFFGRRHKATVGYMNGKYEQYFTGGLIEFVDSGNITDLDGGNLTESTFANWVKKAIKYADEPVIFCGEIVFEALTYWAKQYLEIRQNEETYGMKVATYLTPYGDKVRLIPHLELLKNEYAGWAFCVDIRDMKYVALEGEDTHLVTDIQQPDLKQKIDEYRTWFGVKVINGKKHGILMDVGGIA